MAKEHVHAEEVSHICTTLFTDLTHLGELEIVSALTQPGQLNEKQLCPTRVGPIQTLAIGSLQSRQVPDAMHARIGALLLGVALSVLSSAAQALEMGPCDPAKAVKVVGTSLGEGKRFSTPWK